ncbi:unnamed protein product [Allacma fusca]|uniref:Uncharacterized protein n=1 Tax=Allacma fusca TaxID=39272 RepID=A0A8J2KKS6_9HEXA|nr:unnamed protein product [Allacma fusca]
MALPLPQLHIYPHQPPDNKPTNFVSAGDLPIDNINWSGWDKALADLTPDKIRDFVDQCLEDNPGYEDRRGWSVDKFERFWQWQKGQKLHKVEVAGNTCGVKSASKTFRTRMQRFRKGLDMPCFQGVPPGYVVMFHMFFQKLLKEEKAYLMEQLAAVSDLFFNLIKKNFLFNQKR